MAALIPIRQWLHTPPQQHLCPQLLCVFTDEPLYQTQVCDAYRQRLRATGEFTRQVFDADRHLDPNELLGALAESSLFGDKVLIDLRLNQPKMGKELAKAIATACEWLAHGKTPHHLLVSGPGLNKTQAQSAGFAELLRTGVNIDCKPIADFTQWVKQTAQDLNLTLSLEACNWLAQHTEGNLLAAFQTLEKLALLHPHDAAKPIGLDAVQYTTTPSARYRVFDLSPAVLEGDVARIERMLEGLEAEGEPSTMVLWVLQEDLRCLNEVMRAMHEGQSFADAAKTHRVWGARLPAMHKAVMRMMTKPKTQTQTQTPKPHSHAPLWLTTIAECTHLCTLADQTIKGIHPGNAWAMLYALAMRLGGMPGVKRLPAAFIT